VLKIQFRLKNHVQRRRTALTSLDFIWSRAVSQIMTLGKGAEELKNIISKTDSRPLFTQCLNEFLEVVYQIELNNFCVKKLEYTGISQASIESFKAKVEKLVESKKGYQVYMECLENYDRVTAFLNAIQNGDKKAHDLVESPKKKSTTSSGMRINPYDPKTFLQLKSVVTPMYNRFRQFHVKISAEHFKPLAATFLLLNERAEEILITQMGHGLSPSSPSK